MAREINAAQSTGMGFNTQASEEDKKKAEEEKLKAEQEVQAQASSSPARIGSAESTIAPTIKAMPKPEQAGTGNFANLRSYLSAAQAGGQQRIAQAASKKLESSVAGAKKGIEQARTQFGQAVQTGGLQLSPEEAAARTQAAINQAVSATYQAPTPPAQQTQSATQAPQQAPAITTQQYISPEVAEQFREIVNAQYAGPLSLQQAGLYQTAAEKARAAQTALESAKTASGREQLLRNVFGGSRDYTAGQSKLDALLLNTSQQGLSDIQKQVQQAGNIAQQLQAAETQSGALAEQRKQGLESIRQQARQELVRARTKEETAVEDRLKKLEKDWNKLPEYFRGVLKRAREGKAISAEEAAILGLRSGQSLYNVTPDELVTAQRDAEKLVSKDEVVRQLALAELANLDTSRQLQKELRFKDLKKAGTQDITSSVDVSKLQEAIKEREADAIKKISAINANIPVAFASSMPGYYESYEGPSWGFERDSLLDLIKKYGGFVPMTSPEAPLMPGGTDILRQIAEGKNPKVANTKELGAVEKLLSNLKDVFMKTPQYDSSGIIKDPAMLESIWNDTIGRFYQSQLINPLKKAGVTNVVKTSSDAEAKARSAALRKLLGEIT